MSDGAAAGAVVGITLAFLLVIGACVSLYLYTQGYSLRHLTGGSRDGKGAGDNDHIYNSWEEESVQGTPKMKPKLNLGVESES